MLNLRKKVEARREKKRAKYAEEYGFMEREKLDHLRQQQSPLRGRSGIRR